MIHKLFNGLFRKSSFSRPKGMIAKVVLLGMMSLERSDSLHSSKDWDLLIDCLSRQFSANPIETGNFVSLVPPSDLSLGVLDSVDGALRVEGDSGVN